MGSVAPGLLRKALKDIEFKGMFSHAYTRFNVFIYIQLKCKWLAKCVPGYTIPAGWTIMLVNSAIQLNPNTYKDPLAFNPWRWKVCIVGASFNEIDDPTTYKRLVFPHIIVVYSWQFPWQHFYKCNRILTHCLYLRISRLLEEEIDNALEQSIVKRSWLPSYMFWSPNIGNVFPFTI